MYKYHSSPRAISKAKMPAIITITESTLQYNSLNDIENEIINFLMGNSQDLDDIPDKNNNWRTIVQTTSEGNTKKWKPYFL